MAAVLQPWLAAEFSDAGDQTEDAETADRTEVSEEWADRFLNTEFEIDTDKVFGQQIV